MSKFLPKRSTLIAIIVGALILLGANYLLSQGPTRTEMSFSGQYLAYEQGSGLINSERTTVLFFYAPRCPSCRIADSNIVSQLSTIPNDIQILNVDYDSNKELRKRYGVTSQHTFIQVDKEGNLVQKALGLSSVSEIVAFVRK